MPDWAYYTDTTPATTDYIWSFSGTAQQMYDEWKQECERQDQVYELQLQMQRQQMEEERQLIEDKVRYPLFFWKENI